MVSDYAFLQILLMPCPVYSEKTVIFKMIFSFTLYRYDAFQAYMSVGDTM